MLYLQTVKKTQILVYAQDFDTQKSERHNVEIKLNDSYRKVTKKAIDDMHCNPKAEWLKLGKPDLLTPSQAAAIKEKTKLITERQEFETSNGNTIINLSLCTNEIILLELE